MNLKLWLFKEEQEKKELKQQQQKLDRKEERRFIRQNNTAHSVSYSCTSYSCICSTLLAGVFLNLLTKFSWVSDERFPSRAGRIYS